MYNVEGFGQGCFSPHELCWIRLMDRGEKRPWQVDIGKFCDEDIVDISNFFDDGQ